MTRKQIIVASLVIFACLLGLAYHAFTGPVLATDVVTARVTRGDIERTVVATGTLEPKELVSVGAQASGRLEKLNVVLGQTVKAGELIGRIDSQMQENALHTAEAELTNIIAQATSRRATLAQDVLSFRRQQMMVAGDATSHADYEAAEAALKVVQADVAALDAQVQESRINVENARVNLAYTRISAPIDGVVVSVVTTQGQTVNAVQAAPTIVILAKLDVMTVKTQISEADVIKIRPGMRVYFTILGDRDRRYYATLRQIEPAPDSIVNEVNKSTTSTTNSSSSTTAIYYNALFDIPNDDSRLRALMTAQVSIILGHARNVLILPATALTSVKPNVRNSVRVIKPDGRFERRAVEIGINNNVSVEIVRGLSPGEKVVVGEADVNARTTEALPPGPQPGGA